MSHYNHPHPCCDDPRHIYTAVAQQVLTTVDVRVRIQAHHDGDAGQLELIMGDEATDEEIDQLEKGLDVVQVVFDDVMTHFRQVVEIERIGR